MALAQLDVHPKDLSSRQQLAPASPKSAIFEKLYRSDQLVLHSREPTGPARKQNPQQSQTLSAGIVSLLPVQCTSENQQTGLSVSVSSKVIPDWEQLYQHKHN